MSHRRNRIYIKSDIGMNPIAYAIQKVNNYYISAGPLYLLKCIKCNNDCKLKRAGEINRGLKTNGGKFYCSTRCVRIKPENDKLCKYCKKKFHAIFSSKRLNRGKYCSKECYTSWQMSKENRGKSHPNYTGTYKGRNCKSVAVRRWRSAIFKRDKYTCQKCKQHGGQLNAHHIYLWSKYESMRYFLSNGITLCKKCHNKVHSKNNEASIMHQ